MFITDALTVSRINAIQNAIIDLWAGENIKAGGNVQVVPSANGPSINVTAGGGSGGGSTNQTTHPFKIAWVTPPDGEMPGAITLVAGAVGNIIPSNIRTGTVPTQFSIPGAGTIKVAIALTLTEDSYLGVPESAEVLIVSAAPDPPTATGLPEDTIALAHILIGEIIDGEIHQYVSGSLQYALQRYDSIDDPELEPKFYHTWGRV